jgi:hypothetical protein
MHKLSELNNFILENHSTHYSNIDRLLSTEANRRGISYFNNLLPMFYDEFVNSSNKVLFIGINPSFNDSMHSGVDLDFFRFDLFKGRSKDDQINIINSLVKFQHGLKHGNNNGQKQIPYFKSLESFSNNIGVGNNWEHYDMFPIRCTRQDLFKSILNKKEFIEYKSTFLNLFLDLLKLNKFKAVFVLNSDSSNFILENFNEIKFIKSIEGFKINKYGLYSLYGIPVILAKHLLQGATTKNELKALIEFSKSII